MPAELEPDFVVSDNKWPHTEDGRGGPGDFSHFVPQGLALAPPPIVLPYGSPPKASFYSACSTITHPIKSAPINDDAGGVVYFSSHIQPAEIVAALDLFGFRSLETNYALFIASSGEPTSENYLQQMRIVSYPALAHFFRSDVSDRVAQARNTGAAVQRFIEWQLDKWERGPSRQSIAGILGGDGDWAKERVAFGAMIENSYWGVWRIWSRAWLLTK